MTTETNDTPPAIDLPALIERLRKRAEEDRRCEVNNLVVSELLQPQLDAFDKRDGSHNTYAVRVQLDHRSSAKRDKQYANDLESVIALLTTSGPERATRDAKIEQIADGLEGPLMPVKYYHLRAKQLRAVLTDAQETFDEE